MNLSEYRFKIELHAHSAPVSPCADMTPEALVDIYQQLGFDALVLTNHFNEEVLAASPAGMSRVDYYLSDYDRARRRGAEVGLSVLLGLEIRFTENHNDYLVYGVTEGELPVAAGYFDKGLAAFYQGFKNDRNLILQAHPFRSGMQLADPACLDGIETFNMHPGHNSRVAVAARYAAAQGCLAVGGSDAHLPAHAGGAALRTKTLPATSDELAALLKSRDYLFDIGGSLVLPYGI
ncbi:MAG: PHP domain-containing protein [Eubacteriales bacterium]